MKYNKYLFLVLGMFALFATSCKKSFLPGLNVNPQGISNVPPNLLLSTTEAALAYTQGGDLSRFSSLNTQQTFGFSSQPQLYYTYGYNPGVFDNVWPNLYTSTMENDYTLIHISDATGNNVYSGISRILMAYALQITVDTWGKVPYSKAFQGNTGGTFQPTYDDDKALYDTIASLINNGIADLNNPNKGNILPGADDAIYGGSATQWIKFGHAIKARLYIHQSKGNPAMATSALTEIAASFTGNADNAQYVFGTSETTANPWYQFNEQRTGNITFSTSTLANQLTSLNDPRYAIYIDPVNDGAGAAGSGPTLHYGGLNPYYGGINSPVEFITYDELLFMQAEATLRTSGNFAVAQGFYQAAITANMQKLGVATPAITTYVTANGILPVTSTDAAIAKVASQEYLALYLNPEAWTTWRRTGSPALVPVSGNAVPRRLYYPQSEYNYNAANVPTSTLFTPKIFWDN